MYTIDKVLHIFKKTPNSLGKNLCQLLRNKVEECPDNILQAYKNEIGTYDYRSYKLVYRHIIDLACALKEFGIKRGDLVGMISDNRREWFIADYALLCLGAADVPRGCDSMGTEIRYILSFTGCKVCFFENERQLEKVLEHADEVPELTDAILFDSPDELTMERAALLGIRVHKFIEFEDEAKKASDAQRAAIEKEIDMTEGSDLATIIFTSGTTGTPKGVMLTHDNFLAQAEASPKALTTAKDGDIWLSVLPIWHVLERGCTYIIIALKGGIAYSKPAIEIMKEDMKIIHPQWLVGVPRLYDAFVQSCYRDAKRKGSFSLFTFNISMSIGKRFCWAKDRFVGLVCRTSRMTAILDRIYSFLPMIFTAPFYGLFNLFVYRKLVKKLGGKITGCITAGGSLQSETDLFFRTIGVKLIDLYGMTETAPIISIRNAKKPKSGCSGKIYPTMEVKIVAHQDGVPLSDTDLGYCKKGIIFARGRQVTKGYYRRPDLTKDIIDNNGWINTGDFGMLSRRNELIILGRAKDTIVLLGGENVEPQPIESAICRSKYVESAVVVGQDKKYIAALIVPSKDRILQYANDNRIMYDTYDSLIETSEINTLIREEIDDLVDEKTGFRTCERVGKFTLLNESFKIGKEINAKQIVMRHKIEKLYAKEIKALFAGRNSSNN
ncbi:MAG: AMP-binding protein [Treponema sp.]|nr:AMP-binding protein [Treponema sp.]